MHLWNEPRVAITSILVAIVVLATGLHVLRGAGMRTNRPVLQDTGAIATNSPSPKISAIDESSTTTAMFAGYYITRKFSGGEGLDPATCPAFLVLKNDNPLFTYLSGMVKQGNGINALDEEGNLLLAIELDDSPSGAKKKIIESTSNHPIVLHVQKKVQYGKEAYPCFSFVDVLAVSPVD